MSAGSLAFDSDAAQTHQTVIEALAGFGPVEPCVRGQRGAYVRCRRVRTAELKNIPGVGHSGANRRTFPAKQSPEDVLVSLKVASLGL